MDALFSFLKEFNFENMLPEIGGYVLGLKIWAWVLLMAGPVLLLALGILYTKGAPEDPDCLWAYATKRSRRNREQWEKAHALAGKAWTNLGASLCGVGVLCGVVFFFVDAFLAAVITILVVAIELILILGSRSKIENKLK